MPLPMFQEPPSGPLASVKTVLAVAAGKGGVGKSTVTVNLALALQHAGYRVGIIDADVYGPSVRKMLPEDRMPSKSGDKLLPALCSGISVMTLAYFRQEGQAAVIRAPIANGLISQFLEEVEWGPLDYLLIDFPPGTGDIQLTLAQKAKLDGALLVTTPQEISLMDVRKASDLFTRVQIPILGVIENMGPYVDPQTGATVAVFGKGGGEKLARELGAPLLGSLPLDPQLCACADQGESLFFKYPESATAAQFHAICEGVEQHVKVVKERGVQSFELVWKEMS